MSSTPVSFSIAEVAAASGTDHNLKAALPFTLEHEGMVFEVVHNDPGGATCCGITHDDFAAFLHEHQLAPKPLQNITAAEVAACYREHYWLTCQCGNLPFQVALAVFDSAVLCGPSRPVRWLQIELGVKVDGAMGNNTLAAVGVYVQKHGAKQLADAVIKQRRDFHKTIVAANPALHQFLAGWLNRCDDLESAVAGA